MESPRTILRRRREYQSWVANETLEDYSLRYAAKSFRKWSPFTLANTALGGISFLALEAIGGSITLSYGFSNAVAAILTVSAIVFLTGLPITYYAAKYNIDMDLLTRGAGFGYIGSTITSLIYASFTFIFFALEAAIMAQALELYFSMPLWLGYILCSVIIIPMVVYGVTFINRLQIWTQPLWLVLMIFPFVLVLLKEPAAIDEWMRFAGSSPTGTGFSPVMFGAAATVAFSLIVQIGEQVDYLRFLPDKTRDNRYQWWLAVIFAGAGWILLGGAKLLGGSFLTSLAVTHGAGPEDAVEPIHMYLVAYQYLQANPELILGVATIFVVTSQIKINVTNAYAGSLAWSNFFSRVTHYHPGRVVWLVFNVAIALLLMQMGVFQTLEKVLALYANVAIAWIGAIVSDLVIIKPLKLSPSFIEFRRAHLHDINPVGVVSMAVGSIVSTACYLELFGTMAQAFSPFIALGLSFLLAPVIAWLTKGKFYLARTDTDRLNPETRASECCICGHEYEAPDMAYCPAYSGGICSLCCSLDSRCHDRCKPNSSQWDETLGRYAAVLFGKNLSPHFGRRLSRFILVFTGLSLTTAGLLALFYSQETIGGGIDPDHLFEVLTKLFAISLVLIGVGSWWLVLSQESRRIAEEEVERHTAELEDEIKERKRVEKKLERSNESLQQFAYVASHDLQEPLRMVASYTQLLGKKYSGRLDAKADKYINYAVDGAERMQALIHDLLLYSRLDVEEKRGQVDLETVFEAVVANLQRSIAETGAHVTHDRLPKVWANETQMMQLLQNLVGNALKYRGDRLPEVHVAAEKRDGSIMVSVRDNGIGIELEYLDQIFVIFRRLHTRHEYGGTGIGLSVCKKIVESHNGRIWAESTPGEGTTFTFTVPVKRMHGLPIIPAVHTRSPPARAKVA